MNLVTLGRICHGISVLAASLAIGYGALVAIDSPDRSMVLLSSLVVAGAFVAIGLALRYLLAGE